MTEKNGGDTNNVKDGKNRHQTMNGTGTAHLSNFTVNQVSLGTNEYDFVLKVVSLEDFEILVESIKARRHDNDKKSSTAQRLAKE